MLSEAVLREIIIGGDIETPVVDVVELESGLVEVQLLGGGVLRFNGQGCQEVGICLTE